MNQERRFFSGRTISAFTLVELLVVLAIVAILFAMLATVGHDRPIKALNIQCLNNVRQINIAFLLWKADHQDRFPWQVLLEDEGTLELIPGGDALPHFTVLSNSLRAADLFACPTEKERRPVKTVAELQSSNLSYFVSLDVSSNRPAFSVFAGDRHLAVNGQPLKPGLVTLNTNMTMSWTRELHDHMKEPTGVLTFGDGHGEIVRTDLIPVFWNQGQASMRLIVP
jgi:prepilin-type N-terminal cleavage/methylation domain-containing protein